ncbi:MAG: S1 RNA-binding domain-containing protein [Bacilli bacterium]|nr:S1 RNA-binding domain-containing protein [Bacilli bacterium]
MKVNEIVKVEVTSIKPYGAFIKSGNYTGLIHVSMINGNYIKNINDYFYVGQELYAKVTEVDDKSKHISLSLKELGLHLNEKENKLYETKKGFATLEKMLPDWIEETLEELENK